MRTAAECSEKAAEMESAAHACHDAAIAAAYKKLAVSWRHVARQAAWQDDFRARETVPN